MIQNDDCTSRHAAIDALHKKRLETMRKGQDVSHIWECLDVVAQVPSVQPIECRKQGEWDMFELITSAWYGKQYYFKEENGMAYSRKSHKTMTVHDAILEFIREIGDEGSN